MKHLGSPFSEFIRAEQARVVAEIVPHRLELCVGELCCRVSDRMLFTARLKLPADVNLRKEIWQNGLKVYSGHVRARFQLSAV
jgi:hypothetical protein